MNELQFVNISLARIDSVHGAQDWYKRGLALLDAIQVAVLTKGKFRMDAQTSAALTLADQMTVLTDFLVFGFSLFALWGTRQWLTEHPAFTALLGFVAAGFGAVSILLLPHGFELHHLFASGLYFCLSLGLFFAAFAPSGDRTARLRRELVPLERRLAVQGIANNKRFDVVRHLQNAFMAPRRREMKIARALDELEPGIDRQEGTEERIRRLREKIRRLQQ